MNFCFFLSFVLIIRFLCICECFDRTELLLIICCSSPVKTLIFYKAQKCQYYHSAIFNWSNKTVKEWPVVEFYMFVADNFCTFTKLWLSAHRQSKCSLSSNLISNNNTIFDSYHNITKSACLLWFTIISHMLFLRCSWPTIFQPILTPSTSQQQNPMWWE